MGYITNFMVYTFAMVGVIVTALLVFKHTTQGGGMQKSKHLKIIDTLSLGPRKTLYIVSTGRENFLIAGDVDKTSLISRLETTNTIQPSDISENVQTSFKDAMSAIAKQNYMDKSNIGIKSSMLSSKNNENGSVMRNLANFIKG